jgi:hypothetical protein
MPQYLDHHPTIPEGEVGLHVYVGAQRTWCHTEAPSPDAVRRSYQALGIDLDPRDVAEVQVLPRRSRGAA